MLGTYLPPQDARDGSADGSDWGRVLEDPTISGGGYDGGEDGCPSLVSERVVPNNKD